MWEQAAADASEGLQKRESKGNIILEHYQPASKLRSITPFFLEN